MKCLGNFITAGGPVCIGDLSYARFWTGIHGDYNDMIRYLKNKRDRVLSYKSNSGHDFVLLSMESDLFTIYQSDNSFYVMNILFRDDSVNLNSICNQVAESADKSRLIIEQYLGAHVVVFDSSISGGDIGLGFVGSECSYDNDAGAIPDTTVLGIAEGIWDVYPAGLRREEFRLEGAAFCNRRGRAR